MCSLQQPHHYRYSFGLIWSRAAAIAAAAVVSPFALAGGTIALQMNDEEPIVLHYDGDPVSGTTYSGTHVDSSGRWTITWTYNLNYNPEGGGSVIGQARFTNQSGAPARFTLWLDTPLCPIILNESLMGANLNVRLFAATNGAQVQSTDGQPVYISHADGAQGGAVFQSPFTLGGSGGLVQTNGSFGTPFPSQPAPPVEEFVGHRLNFVLTPGDTAEFNTTFYFGPSVPDNAVDCDSSTPGDVNGDGKVNVADLLLLLTAWGPCSGCAADFNGDGFVNVIDLLILLSNWTS